MLFNSSDFGIFLIVVFALYWWIFKKKTTWQNGLLLVASYVFYGWWDWRFLFLIFISSAIDYFVGKKLAKTSKQSNRNILLILSLAVNLGFLVYFKYSNFFIDSFQYLLTSCGFKVNRISLNIILPVGISFYTFQTLSYTIDIYKKKLEPTHDIIAFFAFVSFFPQLVAGPIERAKNLLPQFSAERKFSYTSAKEGLRQILWGLFLKVVVADSCADVANYAFSNYDNLNGSILFLGAVCFAFQIYGDFGGYSEIAIGTAKLFGFNLMRNFAFPYFSKNIAEFWHRWHISLSTWFRDYVYIPLGGSRTTLIKRIRNIMITFVISGFWHGANWTFVIWGALHGFFYIPNMLINKYFPNQFVIRNKIISSLGNLLAVLFTFSITLIAWIFFRAKSLNHAFDYLKGLCSPTLFASHSYDDRVLLLIIPLIIVEWIQRKKEYALQIDKLFVVFRWIIYLLISILVFHHWGKEIEFIYFQF